MPALSKQVFSHEDQVPLLSNFPGHVTWFLLIQRNLIGRVSWGSQHRTLVVAWFVCELWINWRKCFKAGISKSPEHPILVRWWKREFNLQLSWRDGAKCSFCLSFAIHIAVIPTLNLCEDVSTAHPSHAPVGLQNHWSPLFTAQWQTTVRLQCVIDFKTIYTSVAAEFIVSPYETNELTALQPSKEGGNSSSLRLQGTPTQNAQAGYSKAPCECSVLVMCWVRVASSTWNAFETKSRKQPEDLSRSSTNSRSMEGYWETNILQRNGLSAKRL